MKKYILPIIISSTMVVSQASETIYNSFVLQINSLSVKQKKKFVLGEVQKFYDEEGFDSNGEDIYGYDRDGFNQDGLRKPSLVRLPYRFLMYGDCDGASYKDQSLTMPRSYSLSTGTYCYRKTIEYQFTFDEPFHIKKVVIRDLHKTHTRLSAGITGTCFGLPNLTATTTPTTYEYDVNINITTGSSCKFKYYTQRNHSDDKNEKNNFTVELY